MLPPFPVCTGRDFLHKPEEEDYPLFSRDRSRKRAFLSRSEALDDARESNFPSKNVEYKTGLLEIVFLEYFRADFSRARSTIEAPCPLGYRTRATRHSRLLNDLERRGMSIFPIKRRIARIVPRIARFS